MSDTESPGSAVEEERRSQANAALKEVKTQSISSEVLYWFVPDVNGQLAVSLAIPAVVSAEELNTLCQPVMPMYDLAAAAALIPMGGSTLGALLYKHKSTYPPRYRLSSGPKGNTFRMRLLSAAEIMHIRQRVFFGPGKHTELPQE